MEVRVLRKPRNTKLFRGWGSIVFDVTLKELQFLIDSHKAGRKVGLCDRGPTYGKGILKTRICSIHVKENA